jgi:hypothetical protein
LPSEPQTNGIFASRKAKVCILRYTEEFLDARKIQRLRSGLNQQIRFPVASMLTTRPPKPTILCIKLFPSYTTIYIKITHLRVIIYWQHVSLALCDHHQAILYNVWLPCVYITGCHMYYKQFFIKIVSKTIQYFYKTHNVIK